MKKRLKQLINIHIHKHEDDNMKEVMLQICGRTILNWETRAYTPSSQFRKKHHYR